MHAFDKDCRIHKYSTIYQILDEHFRVRLHFYSTRKEYILNELNNKLCRK